MKGTRPGQHRPQAPGLTDTAAAVIANPVLPSGRGQGQRGQTSLPKAYVVAELAPGFLSDFSHLNSPGIRETTVFIAFVFVQKG